MSSILWKPLKVYWSVIKEYGERIAEVAVLVMSQDVGRDVVKLCWIISWPGYVYFGSNLPKRKRDLDLTNTSHDQK